ncbi:aldose epimerase family protein [Streptomyces sp. NPDC006261]|uniref:aldose epimerase family protein n=1 Tax=Streptomyces sp. NPDC006261 TaxID=3156739 RepID=UPI0033BA4310
MPTVHRKPFGHAHGQSEIDLWTLASGTGVRAEILNYGGILHSLTVPDTAGAPGPVVRSLPALDDHTDKNRYFGAVVGRYANRIAHGRFTLDGTTHRIPANDRGHALHGGPDGFHTRVWEAAGHRTNLGHTLQVDADHYLPVDADSIPEGSPSPVAGTPFDLTAPQPVGERLTRPHPQVTPAGGFDHCWVLRDPAPGTLRRAARLTAPGDRRTLELWTTEPGIQVYTANQLDGAFTDGTGRRHERHGSLCVETQHLPDSPNRPAHPSTVLRPGETLRSRTEWRFPHLRPEER